VQRVFNAINGDFMPALFLCLVLVSQHGQHGIPLLWKGMLVTAFSLDQLRVCERVCAALQRSPAWGGASPHRKVALSWLLFSMWLPLAVLQPCSALTEQLVYGVRRLYVSGDAVLTAYQEHPLFLHMVTRSAMAFCGVSGLYGEREGLEAGIAVLRLMVRAFRGAIGTNVPWVYPIAWRPSIPWLTSLPGGGAFLPPGADAIAYRVALAGEADLRFRRLGDDARAMQRRTAVAAIRTGADEILAASTERFDLRTAAFRAALAARRCPRARDALDAGRELRPPRPLEAAREQDDVDSRRLDVHSLPLGPISPSLPKGQPQCSRGGGGARGGH
jgi:hypothetical protein